MKTSSCKAKGRKLCNWLKESLLQFFPDLQEDDIQVTSSGVTGEDLSLSPKARERFPFTVEGKSRASISVYKWLEQAVSHQEPPWETPRYPIVLAKANRQPPIIIMYAEDFITYIKGSK